MYKKLKKIFFYAGKMLRYGNPREIKEIISHVKMPYILRAIAARLDRRCFSIELTNGVTQEVNDFLDLLKFRKKYLSKGVYLWEVNGKSLYATYTQFLGLWGEYFQNTFESIYAFDWHQKRVLDIGGFVGDSARFFLDNGAEKVIIYEPLEKNIGPLRLNLAPYENQIEIFQKAISDHDGVMTLFSSSEPGSLDFGMKSGHHHIQCECTTFSSILTQHAVDVAKIDCEGCEKYLSHVDDFILQWIPYWMVETHDSVIHQEILKKFEKCGFKKCQEFVMAPSVILTHFRLEAN